MKLHFSKADVKGTRNSSVGWTRLICDDWLVLATRIERLECRISSMTEACEVAYGAIQDAIYCEDGLDGAAGEKVIDMLVAAVPSVAKMHAAAKAVGMVTITAAGRPAGPGFSER